MALRSQADTVVHRVREMIGRGELTPGDRLPIEVELASQLGVSRGSLREGVRALATMGILETRQGDGTYVTSLDASMLLMPMSLIVDLQPAQHAEEVATVRRVLESEAASRAALRISAEQLDEARTALESVATITDDAAAGSAERLLSADMDFHRVIAEASGSDVLRVLIGALSSRTLRARHWRVISDKGAVSSTHQQHTEILHALLAHDPDRARTAMAYHLMGVETFTAAHPEEF